MAYHSNILKLFGPGSWDTHPHSLPPQKNLGYGPEEYSTKRQLVIILCTAGFNNYELNYTARNQGCTVHGWYHKSPREFENREVFTGTYPNIAWPPPPPPPPPGTPPNRKIDVGSGDEHASNNQVDGKMDLWKKTGEENCGNWPTVKHDRKTALILEQNWDL